MQNFAPGGFSVPQVGQLAARAVPHDMQKRASAGSDSPHALHVSASWFPHARQKRACAGFSVEQEGQVLPATDASLGSGPDPSGRRAKFWDDRTDDSVHRRRTSSIQPSTNYVLRATSGASDDTSTRATESTVAFGRVPARQICACERQLCEIRARTP
jgi:hypothetical protein